MVASVAILSEKNVPEICVDEKTKASGSDVIVSNKRSFVRLEEDMSTNFVNQVLSKTIASVINEVEAVRVRNVANGVVSQSKSFGKANKCSSFKCSTGVDEEVVDP
ncbi:unnamed protein product [Citrullus colocynthis]|uniref:Uncharacterized protein n=1 Tax=Citrullus colocynthis TaxID=252529 RepID=A0ABP0XN34_9ROSI